MGTVELRMAFEWTCEECGRDNFDRALIPEFSEEEVDELCSDYGMVDPRSEVRWARMPETVECSHCGAEYETDDPQ